MSLSGKCDFKIMYKYNFDKCQNSTNSGVDQMHF